MAKKSLKEKIEKLLDKLQDEVGNAVTQRWIHSEYSGSAARRAENAMLISKAQVNKIRARILNLIEKEQERQNICVECQEQIDYEEDIADAEFEESLKEEDY